MPDALWQITRLLVSKGLVDAAGAVVTFKDELLDINCIVAVASAAKLTIHVDLATLSDQIAEVLRRESGQRPIGL